MALKDRSFASPLTMKSFNNWFCLIFCALLISGCQLKTKQVEEALPYYMDATFTPQWLSKADPALDTLHKISPFSLVNQNGDTINEQTFAGKIYITDFFFTICPGICPKMTKNMAALQDIFLNQEEVLLLSHSVMPRVDSVAKLKAYADQEGVISSKWHLVTGDQQEIYKLGRQDYFVEEDLGIEKDLDEFLHTENFVLIDQNAHIRGIYNGLNKASIEQLIKDVKYLLQTG